jgi:hypothetical protein
MAAQPTNQIFKTQILMGPVELVFHITHTHPHLNAVTCRTIMPIIVPTSQQVDVTPHHHHQTHNVGAMLYVGSMAILIWTWPLN